MEDKILLAQYGSDKTPLKLGNLELDCYVLEDGTRVFSGRGIQKALGSKSTSGQWLSTYINKGPLANRFSKDLSKITERINNPIKFRRNNAGGSQVATNGYDVTLLVDICSAILDADRENIEVDHQIVMNADIIIRSVAKVGIIALVDEATGYQYDRERYELQQILKKYISEELLPWTKRFPDVFYKELFRLNGWDFTVKGIHNRPGIIGKWTNKIIYEQLPKGVLDEPKRKTPKNERGNRTAKFHQHLTLDMGEPELEKQITKVIALFQASDNMQQFWTMFQKMIDRQNGQLSLPFVFDEDGHTKECNNTDNNQQT